MAKKAGDHCKVVPNVFNKKVVHLIKESQLHGAKRLVDLNGKYWAVALAFLIVAANMVLVELVTRFMDNPTFLARDSKLDDYEQFPAVVLCPPIEFAQHRIENFLNNVQFPPFMKKSFARENIQQLAAFYTYDGIFDRPTLEQLQYLLDYNHLDVETVVRSLTSSCEETLLKWRGEIQNCSTLFTMELTGDGFCCTFNGRSLRNKFKSNIWGSTKPRWFTNKIGPFYAMMLLVNQSHVHSSVDLSYQWIALQRGGRFFDISINGTPLSPGSEHWLGYTSLRFNIDSASSLSTDLRKCRLEKGEPLQYFPVYGRRYCLLECEMSRAISNCGCLRNTHPRPPGFNYCRASQLQCARQASVPSVGARSCHCYPTCESMKVFTQVSAFNMDTNKAVYDTFYDGIDIENTSVVRIFITSQTKAIFTRKSYFTDFNFFSQCGGIFNVYFGCSILTIMEFIVIVYNLFKPMFKPKERIKKKVTFAGVEDVTGKVKTKLNTKKSEGKETKFVKTFKNFKLTEYEYIT